MPPKRKNSAGCNSAAKRRCRRTSTSDENTPPKKCTKAKKVKAKLQDILKEPKMPILPANVLEETLNDFVTNYLALAQQSGSHTYSELTFLAILSSQDKCLTVEEIYQFVQGHFPAFWQKEKNARKRIRHVLAETTCFRSYKLPEYGMNTFQNKQEANSGGVVSVKNQIYNCDPQPSTSAATPKPSKIKTLYTVDPEAFRTKISTGFYRPTKVKKIFKDAQHEWANYGDEASHQLWVNVSQYLTLEIHHRVQTIEHSNDWEGANGEEDSDVHLAVIYIDVAEEAV